MGQWDLHGAPRTPLWLRLVIRGLDRHERQRKVKRSDAGRPRGPRPGFMHVDERCDCYDQAYFEGVGRPGGQALNRTGLCNLCAGTGLWRTIDGTREHCDDCGGRGRCLICGGTGFVKVEMPAR